MLGSVGIVGHVDPAVLLVLGEEPADRTGAQVGEGLAFPGDLLAAVLAQPDGHAPIGQGAEHTAGLDGLELLGITDQNQPSSAGVGSVEQASEGAGADHGRFVDDQDGAVIEPLTAGVEVQLQFGDGS